MVIFIILVVAAVVAVALHLVLPSLVGTSLVPPSLPGAWMLVLLVVPMLLNAGRGSVFRRVHYRKA
ncbi:hypothetical protein [Streptomyces sp. CL12]|uniref:hypothetical protein n=1 Tax=Streptomyces sp. CL12 TaxID=3391744 RepID=UPI003A8006E1